MGAGCSPCPSGRSSLFYHTVHVSMGCSAGRRVSGVREGRTRKWKRSLRVDPRWIRCFVRFRQCEMSVSRGPVASGMWLMYIPSQGTCARSVPMLTRYPDMSCKCQTKTAIVSVMGRTPCPRRVSSTHCSHPRPGGAQSLRRTCQCTQYPVSWTQRGHE